MLVRKPALKGPAKKMWQESVSPATSAVNGYLVYAAASTAKAAAMLSAASLPEVTAQPLFAPPKVT